MVHRTLFVKQTLIHGLIIGSLMTVGCTSKNKVFAPDGSENQEALTSTESVELMEAGSQIERDALKQFEDFYADYSVDAIQQGIRAVYADDAWFGDPFHIVQGIDELEHYFVVMAEPVESCTFRIDSMQRSGEDYFARWTMILESKAAKGEIIQTPGISHVRFNAEGKVIFQQDYWDTSAMLDRLPVVGYWTRLVKGRIEKGLEK